MQPYMKEEQMRPIDMLRSRRRLWISACRIQLRSGHRNSLGPGCTGSSSWYHISLTSRMRHLNDCMINLILTSSNLISEDDVCYSNQESNADRPMFTPSHCPIRQWADRELAFMDRLQITILILLTFRIVLGEGDPSLYQVQHGSGDCCC